jgi:hypothetical protein
VNRFVGIGIGVSDAKSGCREAHPALKSNPTKIAARKIRDILQINRRAQNDG